MDYKWIDYTKVRDYRGLLSVIEDSNIGFDIKRVFWVDCNNINDIRGGHAHHETKQVLVCVKGKCEISIDDGKKDEISFELSEEAGKAVYLGPKIWHIMYNFTEDCRLLVLASTNYDKNEEDYIRNRKDFDDLYGSIK